MEIIYVLLIIILLVLIVKHSIGLRKIQRYLKDSNDEFYKDRESSLIKFSTYEQSHNDTAYEYLWSQRYKDHKDSEFVQLCSVTFKNGLYCIVIFVILLLCK